MKKPNYATLSTQHANAQRELSLNQLALSCVMHDSPEATIKHVKEDLGDGYVGDGRYDYALYRTGACHGGVLIVTFRYGTKQRPSTTAHYWDDFQGVPCLQYFERLAIERLRGLLQLSADVAMMEAR